MNTSQKYSKIHVNKYILNWRLKLNVGNTKVYTLLNHLKKSYYIALYRNRSPDFLLSPC